MKRYTNFLLLSLILSFGVFTAKGQSSPVTEWFITEYDSAWLTVSIIDTDTTKYPWVSSDWLEYEPFELWPETKTIPVSTYGLLVQDAVQKRVFEEMTVAMQERIDGLEQIQGLTEANLNRQITILQATNQALEIQTAALEGKYGVLEKQLGKKEKGNKWLKVAVGAAFVLGIFAGK